MPEGAQQPPRNPSLGEHLVAAGLLSPANLDRAQRLAEDSGERTVRHSVVLGLMVAGLIATLMTAILSINDLAFQ